MPFAIPPEEGNSGPRSGPRQNAMEIAAMAEGLFSPDPSPYLTEELEQHLGNLGQDENEEDFQ